MDIRHAILFCNLPLLMFSCRGGEEEEAAEKPNVIFILADDMGYYDAGCYGQEIIQTPNIDKLARQGMRFTQFYSGSPVCAPARSVLMTGQHTGHTTVRANGSPVVGKPYPFNRVPLKPDDHTIAEMCKDAGYVTGVTGKWGLGEPRTTGIPNKQGFDEWFGYLNQNFAHNYYPEYLWHNTDSVVLEGNLDGKRQTYSHHLMTDFGLEFIEKNRDNTFFLFMAYTLPHDDYVIPSRGIYGNMEGWTGDEKVYAAMITLLDRDIGRMTDLLEELGIAERTVVFFCSDNGAARRWKRFNSMGPFRGKKRSVYEGGIRVPLVVRYPGVTRPGSVSDFTGYFADIMPTVAEIAGEKIHTDIDGISFLPVLKGEEMQQTGRLLYWEFHSGGFKQAARMGKWKAVRFKDREIELYNLEEDISEQHDVAAEHPRISDVFRQYMKNQHTPSKFWPVE